MFEAIARDDALVDLMNSKIRYLLLSGAHVDLDTLDLLRQIFPGTSIAMVFGSTMVLSQAATRVDDDSLFSTPARRTSCSGSSTRETGERCPTENAARW